MKRSLDQRRRDLEACLDQLAESAIVTEGDVSLADLIPLTVADDLLDYAAAYARCPKPKEVAQGRSSWRETFGSFRGLRIHLKTAERRKSRKVAA